MVLLFLGNGLSVVAQELTAIKATDWPWWRGPHRNGVASADQRPPLSWSATENVIWKCPVPGHGHGSPTLVGDQIFLATCHNDAQVVLCFDAETGTQQWEQVVHQGGLVPGGNQKRSQAASTVACDGERLFVNFHNRDAVYTTALDRDGKQIWQTKISDYVLHQGYGSSPAVFGPLVLVSADNKGGGPLRHWNEQQVMWSGVMNVQKLPITPRPLSSRLLAVISLFLRDVIGSAVLIH